MTRELLAQSPLLVLPIIAMLIFLAVWVAASIRVLTRPKQEMEAFARLPLDESRTPRGRIQRKHP